MSRRRFDAGSSRHLAERLAEEDEAHDEDPLLAGEGKEPAQVFWASSVVIRASSVVIRDSSPPGCAVSRVSGAG